MVGVPVLEGAPAELWRLPVSPSAGSAAVPPG